MTTERPRTTRAPMLTAEDEARIAEARQAMAELIARVPRAPGHELEPSLIFRAAEQG
jgi:hypothetical protein